MLFSLIEGPSILSEGPSNFIESASISAEADSILSDALSASPDAWAVRTAHWATLVALRAMGVFPQGLFPCFFLFFQNTPNTYLFSCKVLTIKT